MTLSASPMTNQEGIAAGDFHIDPWRPVPRAIITHAHSDRARFGAVSAIATWRRPCAECLVRRPRKRRDLKSDSCSHKL